MKAAIRTKRGPPEVIKIMEIDMPEPDKDEVLVAVKAATVTRGDAIMLKVPWILYPLMRLLVGYRSKKIFGTEYAGIIEAVGEGVTEFKPGDEVFGLTTQEKMGGQAEKIVVSASKIIAKKPKTFDFKQSAAIIVGAMTALQILRKKGIEEAKRVMIYGASGSVGSFAVQVAKNYGAKVTGVCSTQNMDMVRSLGADQVLDYTSVEFSTHQETYDLIFDAVNKLNKKDRNRFKHENTRTVTSMASTKESVEALQEIAELADTGKLVPFIDQEFSLDQIVEAYKIVVSGRKRGNIVILMG